MNMKTQTNKTTSTKVVKQKLVLNWPTNFFTIEDLQTQNPTAKNITLRFRVKRALGNGELTQIGRNSGSVGRPTLVFAKSPVSKEVLAAAVKANVTLDEQFSKLSTPVAQFNQPVTSVKTPTTSPEAVKVTKTKETVVN